jgi:diguanylate cyclase (GGDEF)-like protein
VVYLEYLLIICLSSLLIVISIQYKKYISIKFVLNRTNEINERMINISEELSQFNDINKLYEQLLNETINLIEGAECGSVLIYNKENDFMDYKACVGYDLTALSNVHLKKEELYLYEKSKLRGADIIINPLMLDQIILAKHNLEEMMNTNALEIKTSLSSPLYINGEFYGLINVDNRRNIDAFNKKDIKLITYITRQLEIAIKNTTLMNELVDALKIDKLTNIYNRRYFEQIMEKMFQSNTSKVNKFSLAMIDLDKFKLINDTYGHKVGDEILIYFARILTNNLGNKDMAVRYAGDEFVLFLNNIDKKSAQVVIARIREAILDYPYEEIQIEFSAGICEYEENMNLDRVLTNADDEMYKEKRNRKNSI